VVEVEVVRMWCGVVMIDSDDAESETLLVPRSLENANPNPVSACETFYQAFTWQENKLEDYHRWLQSICFAFCGAKLGS
jgi:hypothetical protein